MCNSPERWLPGLQFISFQVKLQRSLRREIEQSSENTEANNHMVRGRSSERRFPSDGFGRSLVWIDWVILWIRGCVKGETWRSDEVKRNLNPSGHLF